MKAKGIIDLREQEMSDLKPPVAAQPQLRETRLTKFICARMSSPSAGQQQLTIQDISKLGIRGKVKKTPLVGETISVKFLDGQILRFQVRWVRDEVFGAKSGSPIILEKIAKE